MCVHFFLFVCLFVFLCSCQVSLDKIKSRPKGKALKAKPCHNRADEIIITRKVNLTN